MVTLLNAHMANWCACHRFKESLEQELERSWTTHELWFHQPSVPSTIVRRKFKILDATGGPHQRNSHWKLLISKLALSPLCFKSSHISNCLATVLIVFVEVNMVSPLVAPLVAKKQLETLPIWSHSPCTRAHQVARSLEVVEPKPHWVSTGSVMSTTWGFLSLPGKTSSVWRKCFGRVIRKPYSKVDLQQPAAARRTVYIHTFHHFSGSKKLHKVLLDEVGRVMKLFGCPQKKHG